MANTPEVWEKHWNNLKGKRAFFGYFLSFYRTYLIAPAVKYYLEKYFDKEGVYIECGSGTGQTLQKVEKGSRKFYAIDFSKKALEEAKKIKQFDKFILADIRELPFKDESINGIWNLGIMEHFEPGECDSVLKEFKRVLKPRGKIVMFWPIKYAPYEILLNSTTWFMKKFLKKRMEFFPDEPSILSSKKQAKKIVLRNKFKSCEVYFNIKDFFTYAVVIAEKGV